MGPRHSRHPLVILCFAIAMAMIHPLHLDAQIPAEGIEAKLDRKLEALNKRHQEQMEALRADYEKRLLEIETRLETAQSQDSNQDSDLADAIDDVVDQVSRRGIAQLGQTTIFDNSFNPAISLTSDFVVSATPRDASFSAGDRFFLRDVELGIVGRIDPYASYFAFIHYSLDIIELEEAYGFIDQALPDTFTAKVGRFNMDFGKLSVFHEHDLPFVDKPQVLQEYLGGALRGTGIEIHHWFPLGDTNLIRWSVGMVNSLDGDAHAVFGPAAGPEDEEGAPDFSDRSFKDFGYSGRITALFKLSDEMSFQIGSSVAWAPTTKVEFTFSKTGSKRSAHLGRLVFGADSQLQWKDQSSAEAFTLAGEFLMSKADSLREETGASPSVSALGFYGYATYALDRNFSFGVSGGLFEHAENNHERSWDAGAFVTWQVNHFNRVRFELRYFDDPEAEVLGFMLQWTTILGSHGHGIPW